MYDQRIAEQMRLLERFSVVRQPTNMEETNKLESPGSEREVKRKGPRIISNVRIASPRQVLDSVSEAASTGSVAESLRWQEVRRDKPKQAADSGGLSMGVAAGPAASGGEKERNSRPIKTRPNSAVVVIRAKEEHKTSYSEILKLAKQRVNINAPVLRRHPIHLKVAKCSLTTGESIGLLMATSD